MNNDIMCMQVTALSVTGIAVFSYRLLEFLQIPIDSA